MKKLNTKGLSAVMALLGMTLTLDAWPDAPRESIHVPVGQLKWFATGIGPLQGAAAYGDMSTGAHGTFLKMPKGFVSPVHSHSNEYQGVVISGIVVNSEVGQPDITMKPGSYWFQKGNVNHVTKCVSSKGCVVFLTQPDKFDFIPDQGKSMKK